MNDRLLGIVSVIAFFAGTYAAHLATRNVQLRSDLKKLEESKLVAELRQCESDRAQISIEAAVLVKRLNDLKKQ